MQGRTFWLSMHLTRPKSSKGRSRPAVSTSTSPHPGAGDSTQRPPESPDCAAHSRPDRNLRSQSQPIMWQAGQLSQEQVVHMLQHAPAAPPLSLNKYKVLPSIGRRRSEVGPAGSLDKDMSTLSLCDDVILQQRHRHEEPDEVEQRAKPPDPGPAVTTEAGATGTLLLAVRAPCGRRFQQHFEPTDTLLTVRASAELRYGVQYGDASIETVDMPRRTFTDLDMTLAQCGILNRSVLCISQHEHE